MIGPATDTELTVAAATPEEGQKVMDELLSKGELDAAVAMHYAFPLGVSTVGRVIAPANGRPLSGHYHGTLRRQP